MVSRNPFHICVHIIDVDTIPVAVGRRWREVVGCIGDFTLTASTSTLLDIKMLLALVLVPCLLMVIVSEGTHLITIPKNYDKR